jgi:putative hydrolase of the HAD superfamily
MIKALSFDLWDTLIIDDSDETKRQQLRLLAKRAARIEMLWKAAKELVPNFFFPEVVAAYESNREDFNRKWREEHITEKVFTRIQAIGDLLNIVFSENTILRISRGWEEMELEVSPDLVPGAREVISLLSQTYPLAVVSDAIVSPGRVLRKILDKLGLWHYFTAAIFSDEVGASKPSPKIFKALLEELSLPPHQVIHIGDRPVNDVAGAEACGIKAVLFQGVKNRELDATIKPDAVCQHLSELPELIKKL